MAGFPCLELLVCWNWSWNWNWTACSSILKGTLYFTQNRLPNQGFEQFEILLTCLPSHASDIQT